MPTYYVDTSALVKPYLRERGAAWMTALSDSGTVVTSTLSIAEAASALARRAREGSLPSADRDRLFQTFVRRALGYQLIDLTQKVLEDAARLLLADAPAPTLRTLDAIHLATANLAFLTVGHRDCILVSSDRRLLIAAEAAGTAVENPEDYA